jgi:methionyl-tRNA formyltransferase
MRIVFLGTPEFAVPSLQGLARRYDIVGVVTQPDRPAGRGRRIQPPAAKLAAATLGLPVFQPERIRAPDALARVKAWAPDIAVVAAFGQILPPAMLALPELGCVNLHASLLPRWRGASPVQYALIHGDPQTGVTVMKMDAGLDTGPILAQRALPIRPDHTGGTLARELAWIGADLLVETLPLYAGGQLSPVAQSDSLATFAPRLRTSDGALDPSLPALQLERRVRALAPRPGTRLRWEQETLRIHAAHAVAGPAAPPGTVLELAGSPAMATADGLLSLDEAQLPGGKSVPGKAFLAGHPSLLGAVLSRSE